MKPNGKNMKLAAFDDIFKNEETRQEEQMERVVTAVWKVLKTLV